MPKLAGAITSLGLLALPAVPSPTYHSNFSAADTWSLTSTEGVSAVGIVFPITGTDTWSLSATEASSTLGTYPEQFTQLGALALPAKYVAVTAKGVSGTNVLSAVETWSLTFTEDPTDTVSLDTWDTWALSFTLNAGLSVSQTFSANEAWGLSWNDTSSVLSGAPVLLTPVDTWSLSLTESASAVAVSIVSAGDSWPISWTDASALAVTQTAITATDTWSLTQAETAFVGVLATVPILASDEWLLSLTDGSQVSISTPPPPDLSPGRVILIRAQSYIVRVR